MEKEGKFQHMNIKGLQKSKTAGTDCILVAVPVKIGELQKQSFIKK